MMIVLLYRDYFVTCVDCMIIDNLLYTCNRYMHEESNTIMHRYMKLNNQIQKYFDEIHT